MAKNKEQEGLNVTPSLANSLKTSAATVRTVGKKPSRAGIRTANCGRGQRVASTESKDTTTLSDFTAPLAEQVQRRKSAKKEILNGKASPKTQPTNAQALAPYRKSLEVKVTKPPYRADESPKGWDDIKSVPQVFDTDQQAAGKKFGLLLGSEAYFNSLIEQLEKLIVEGKDKLTTQEVADLLQVPAEKLRLESKKHKYIRDWLQPIDSHKPNHFRWATAGIYNRLLKARDYLNAQGL